VARRKSAFPLAWVISGILVFGGFAVADVSLALRNDALGRRLKQLEREERDLSRRVANEERNWTLACTVGNIRRLLAEKGLAMGYPSESQIVRLGEWPDEGGPAR